MGPSAGHKTRAKSTPIDINNFDELLSSYMDNPGSCLGETALANLRLIYGLLLVLVA